MSETKIANPGPLGLSGFALTTMLLSLVNAGIIANTTGDAKELAAGLGVVLSSAFFYGGLAQLLAGMWEFRTGNTFGAYAFGSFGAFWLTVAVSGIYPAFGFLSDLPTAAWFLTGWAIVTGILMIASIRTNGATVAVFVLLFITFVLLAAGAFNKQGFGVGLTQIGGYFGLATAIVAWYTALAGVLTATSGGKMNLPVFPLA